MRAEAVHKAQPIRRYEAVEPRHSEKPLTEPKSPKFSSFSWQKKNQTEQEEGTAQGTRRSPSPV